MELLPSVKEICLEEVGSVQEMRKINGGERGKTDDVRTGGVA